MLLPRFAAPRMILRESSPPRPARWRPVLALGAGAAAACGFEPLGAWLLALIGAAVLVVLATTARNARASLWLGWLWGVGHFSLGLNWIATAFTYQAKMPGWLGWLAVVFLSFYLAVYPAMAAWGAWAFRRDLRAVVPGFAACWIVSEWLRSWVFTGFAWNPLGAALLGDFAHPGLAALAPWLGTYGLSGLCALLAAAVAAAFMLFQRGTVTGGCVFLVVPLLAVALGNILPPADMTQGARRFTLVQPGIAQDHLDDPAYFEAHFEKTAGLSVPLAGPAHAPVSPRVVLWPESGLSDYLRDDYPDWVYYQGTYAGNPWLARMRIAKVIGPGSLLLTGAVDPVMANKDRIGAVRNVVTALDDQGRIVGSYAKAHLVPYGEYLPMRALLGPLGLARLVPGEIDFQPGPGPRTLDLGAYGKVGVQICYEIVFSGQVVDRANRPDYLIGPTNDGWFGRWGPPQDLAHARLRAIEEGLPVLRSTTSGISGVIDARGVVRRFIAPGMAGRIDDMIPPALPPTVFARYGNLVPLLWACVLLVSALVLRRRRG